MSQNKSLVSIGNEEHRTEHRIEDRAPRPFTISSQTATAPADHRTDRRKFIVQDQHIPAVIDACRRGVSEVRIARSLGVNYRTWMRVRAEDERIAGALAETHKFEEDELVSLLLDKARAGETTAIIFALKGRHGYRDHGAAPTTAEAKVNVVINLPAARSTVEEYVQAIEGEVIR